MASQITGVPIVWSTICSGADQRKHQSCASLAFLKGIHRWSLIDWDNIWLSYITLSSYHVYTKIHDDVIKCKHYPRYWPFVRGIHRWPVNSPHEGQWRRGLIFSFICVWINGWVNDGVAGDLIRHRAHNDVIVMSSNKATISWERFVGRHWPFWTFIPLWWVLNQIFYIFRYAKFIDSERAPKCNQLQALTLYVLRMHSLLFI